MREVDFIHVLTLSRRTTRGRQYHKRYDNRLYEIVSNKVVRSNSLYRVTSKVGINLLKSSFFLTF